MSKSYKHTPICGITTSKSEKQDKLQAHKKFRRKVKKVMKEGKEILPLVREVSNIFSFSKDGKYWFGDLKNNFTKSCDNKNTRNDIFFKKMRK